MKVASAAAKFRPWAAVRRHDRLVREEFEDLITWARDDLQKETKALEQVAETAAKENCSGT